MKRQTAALALMGTALYAQQQTQPPLVLHRTPAPQDLQAAIATLQEGDGEATAPTPDPSRNPERNVPPPTVRVQRRAPRKWHPDLAQLDNVTRQALALAQQYQRQGSIPAAGDDGRLQYTYGTGLATIVCAPLHLCVIELEPGETLTNKPMVSDKRWDIGQERVGVDQTLVFLRPRYQPLDSNLLLASNRRSYYLRVVATEHDYMARVSFAYPPEQQLADWESYQQATQAMRILGAPTLPRSGGYRMEGKKRLWSGRQHPAWWPERVEDDGKWTYITVPRESVQIRYPKLMLVGQKGLEPANYSINGNTYVVHGLFTRAALIEGTGHKQEAVTIISPRGTP